MLLTKTDTELGLLRAIHKTPKDLMLRYALADHYRDKGLSILPDFMQLHIDSYTRKLSLEEASVLYARKHDLIRTRMLCPTLPLMYHTDTLPQYGRRNTVTMNRGLPRYISCYIDTLEIIMDAMCMYPIVRVNLLYRGIDTLTTVPNFLRHRVSERAIQKETLLNPALTQAANDYAKERVENFWKENC